MDHARRATFLYCLVAYMRFASSGLLLRYYGVQASHDTMFPMLLLKTALWPDYSSCDVILYDRSYSLIIDVTFRRKWRVQMLIIGTQQSSIIYLHLYGIDCPKRGHGENDSLPCGCADENDDSVWQWQ